MICHPSPQGTVNRHSLVALLVILLSLKAAVPCLHAQDTDNDNPDGPSGSYNVQVTTGGQYDPYTCNAKRTVTDLTVPNSGLALTRYYNSRRAVVANDHTVLGDGSNWRHSYQWALAVADGGQGPNNNYPTAYNIAYPDGSVVTFRISRTYAPHNNAPFWYGPGGTQDRLYVPGPFSFTQDVYLLLSDGTQVAFLGGSTNPQWMKDPYGAVTTFSYNPGGTGYLSQVIEPGGRWLQYFYQTIQSGGTTWILLDHVVASTGQTVHYYYSTCGTQTGPGGTTPYYALSSVSYDSEASVSGNGVVTAQYTYQTNGSSAPDLLTAIDPHYAGAMVAIRYQYFNPGYVQEEQNLGSLLSVSHLTRDNNANTSTDIRGDAASGGSAIFRVFSFDQSSVTVNGSSVTTNAKLAQPTSATDFEGNTSHFTYGGVYSPYLYQVYDANGHKTTYGHEAYAGKVTSVTLPDNRQRNYVWGGMDGNTSLTNTSTSYPYYLAQATDERGQSTNYHRDPNTGLLTEIDYPDGGYETFANLQFN